MSTTRLQYRQHLGRALGKNYYVSSATTAISPSNREIVDAARTEHDQFWNGSTIRVASEDRMVAGGTGVNTNRTPTINLDRALSSTPGNAAPYEMVKSFSFLDMDEALDDALASMYPYFYDPVDDITTVIEIAGDIEYNLPATWMEITSVQRQVYGSSPTRYRPMAPGTEYVIGQDAAQNIIILRYTPYAGRVIRVFAKAIPTLGSTDASTSIHPWQVVVPGAMHYLYSKGGNPDAGSLSTRWEQEAQRALALFEKRKREFHMNRPATDLAIPVISVG